ncbi:DUF5615 family PIN-like protein [Altericista sp. CCNU0014]|uniref:DUF5615 family PIN-like protein n=1 Tax=Altericista sp. CCNU0014 TaxID=3082949 RepID=UPI00384EB782
MLILLDENLLSRKLKKSLVDAGHTVKNVEDMGWRCVKDRELLALASAYPFDAFITADKNLPYQQNLRDLALRIVIFDVIFNLRETPDRSALAKPPHRGLA